MEQQTILYRATDDSIDIVSKIMAAAAPLEGKARKRILHRSDAADLLALIAKYPAGKTFRSYSGDGFVANAYNYPAYITRCNAIKRDDGTYAITVERATATRSHGCGALLTVDNRTAEL